MPRRSPKFRLRSLLVLIAVVALAFSAGLTVTDLVDSLFVHPTLSESLAEAAD